MILWRFRVQFWRARRRVSRKGPQFSVQFRNFCGIYVLFKCLFYLKLFFWTGKTHFSVTCRKSFCLTSESNSAHSCNMFKKFWFTKTNCCEFVLLTSNIRFQQLCSRNFPFISKNFRSGSKKFRRRLLCSKRQKFSNCSSEHVKCNSHASAETYHEKAETFLLQIRKKKKSNKL